MKRKEPEQPGGTSSSESEGLLAPVNIGDSDAATSSSSDGASGSRDMDSSEEAVRSPSAAEPGQQSQKQADSGQVAGSRGPAQPDAPTRCAPTLPWMRVPIAIEGGATVPLAEVKGLHPQLDGALQAGEACLSPT